MTATADTTPKTSAQPANTENKTSADKTDMANEASAKTVETPDLPAGSDELAKKAPTVADTKNAPANSGNTENAAKATDTSTKPAMTGEEQTSSKETTHVIVKGDTYWDLAKTFYGAGEDWRKIREANNMRPHALRIGAELTIPAK
jgi:5'-nucleotidase